MLFLTNLPVILINTLTVLNLVLLMQLLFGLELCKKWQHYPAMAGVCFAVLTGIILPLRDHLWLRTAAVYALLAVLVCVLAGRRFWKYLLYTVPAILLYVQWSCVLQMVDKLFLLERFDLDGSGELLGPFYILADVILLLPLCHWLARAWRTGRRIRLNGGETLALCLFCIFSPRLVYYMEQLRRLFDDFYFPIIWLTFNLILNAAFFYGILHRSAARYYRLSMNNYREQFRWEYRYFKAYKDRQRATAQFRHDWKNHMLLLQGLLDSGKYEKAAAYVQTLTEESASSGKRVLTGNEVVDIVLSAKMERIEAEGIRLTCGGGLEPLSFMEDADLCVLFSNLIDNAIEANARCAGERFLTLRASHRPALFLAELSNAMDGALLRREGRILSSKEDPGAHGIGSQNISAVVRKYGGESSIRAEGGTFTFQMVFPLDRSSQK